MITVEHGSTFHLSSTQQEVLNDFHFAPQNQEQLESIALNLYLEGFVTGAFLLLFDMQIYNSPAAIRIMMNQEALPRHNRKALFLKQISLIREELQTYNENQVARDLKSQHLHEKNFFLRFVPPSVIRTILELLGK